MILPSKGYNYSITSEFGSRPSLGDFHTGTDFAPSPSQPTPFVACADGVVTFAGLGAEFTFQNQKYRNPTIIISHGNGVTSMYAHMDTIYVKAGQTVKQGEILGLCGNKGASLGIHLHFEIRINNIAVDAIKYINKFNYENIGGTGNMNNNNQIIVQSGWGISHVAKAAGYADFADPSRWDAIAKLNGVNSWTAFKLYAGQSVIVKESTPTTGLVDDVKKELDKIAKENEAKYSEQLAELEKRQKELELKEKESLEKIQIEQEKAIQAIKDATIIPVVVDTPQTQPIDIPKVELTEWEHKLLEESFKEFTDDSKTFKVVIWWKSLPSWFTKVATVALAVGISYLITYLTGLDEITIYGLTIGSASLSVVIALLQKLFKSIEDHAINKASN